jgi:23S rRNA pseudouridine2604 synthase
MEENLKRLNKFIGETGYSHVEKLTKSSRRSRNYQWYRSRAGTKVSPSDEVRIDGKLIREKTENLFTLLYKPVE